jgi:hypothetical protein
MGKNTSQNTSQANSAITRWAEEELADVDGSSSALAKLSHYRIGLAPYG